MTETIQHMDIQAEKTIDWCVGRGVLPADWLVQLKSVQAKVKNTLTNPAFGIPADITHRIEPPEGGGSYWTLVEGFHELEQSILKQRGLNSSESSKLKNFFGSYQDAPLKALNALIALYKKNNLFLAEGSRLLTQAVQYDIPQLKKLIVTNTKQNEDLIRKISEEQHTARTLKLKSQQQLKENWALAYVGTDLAAQLKKRAEEDVPELINLVIQATKDPKFGESIEYYREFVRYSLEDPSVPTNSASAAAASNPFPTLTAIRNGELIEIKAKQEETKEESTTSSTTTADDSASGGAIDWGISVEGAGDSSVGGGGGGGGINWDLDITTEPAASSDASATSGGINWGDDDSTSSAAAPATINWDLEVTDSSAAEPSSSPSASPLAPLSSLEHDATRHSFLSELQELEVFLAERLVDLSTTKNDDLAAAVFTGKNVPHCLAVQSAQTTQGYLTSVRNCLTALRSPRLTQLLMIRTSKRYIERVVAGIRQQEASITRLERAAVEHESRRVELSRITSRSQHELSTLITRTRMIKTKMETEISLLFQNRPTHLVGEINQLLQ